MAKRFATMFFIMIGVVIFLLSAFLLVLFLAPGVSVFGIKYISINTHGVNTGKIKITSTFNQKYGNTNFSGTVIINSSEVPVYVDFAEAGRDYYYEYYDNYSGITKSTFEDPSIIVERNDNGDAVLTVKSFETFAFENANSKRYVKVYIPLANISVSDYAGKEQYIYGDSDPGEQNKYQTSLIINAGAAPVSFSKSDSDRAPAFKRVAISTTNNISYNGCHIKAMTFAFETNKSIRITAGLTSNVDAKSYELVSNSGNILVNREVKGDLSAKTRNGNIQLFRCNNLSIDTELGDVYSCIENMKIEVKGIVNIKTTAGSITINKILGDGQNKIETGSGSVSINSMKNGTVSTHRGSVNIKSVNDVVISSNMGNISVEEVLKSIDVSTKRGKVMLGGEGMILKSPKVSSHLGKIKVINASEKVYIETISSDIEFVNGDSTDIEIHAGGKLAASNLKGLINMSLNETADLEFDDISKTTKILLKDGCSYVNINALNTVKDDLYYLLYGNPVSIYEANNTGYATYSLFGSKEYFIGENTDGVIFEILGDNQTGASSAKVDIYFNKSVSTVSI